MKSEHYIKKTKEYLTPALRQHRHNFDSDELIPAFDYDETIKLVADFMKLAESNVGLDVWTLIAPDGRTFKAESPLKCCALEMRERVPPEVAIARIKEFVTCKTCGDRLVGHEDESATECRWCVTGWKPCQDDGHPMIPY